ncbi:hypothetical protein [Epibacterium sp. Ofav1-8]|uniref:hypothetical protein n=1 Tax=Epibacterium sp. Ofav1-8 TaxID=2917735 RepID=UPI001EF6E056|nr:hypothetical protein [Epibacterium sp. Ofav1-8]MCG7625568.1 hypothetical protein [Epibacterium sp. Ofav1-8]
MTKRTPLPPAEVTNNDPYSIRSIEQLFSLFDGGEFLSTFMSDHRDLLVELQDHNDQYGHKGAKGSFSISVAYELGGAGDLGMKISADFKGPKKPASNAAAYVDGQGQMTLYSPMMKRMHGGVRDVTPHDPETGEVRDV